jgi:hypothetical protein
MPPPLRRWTPKTTSYTPLCPRRRPRPLRHPRAVLPLVRLAARDHFPSLNDFPQIADCQATPSLRPNAHTEVRLIDSVDVARGSGQHGSSRALGPLRYRAH